MRAKLFFSWIALLAGAVYGANLAYTGQIFLDPLVAALAWGYTFWSFFWGVPVVWRWWRRYSPYHRSSGLLLNLFWFVMSLIIPLAGGYLYGVLGGALYQFLLASRQARKRSA